jgi:hypothetical protein
LKKAIVFAPSPRIVSLLRRSGGISVQEAISRAERRVEAVRDQCIAALDEKIDEASSCSASASDHAHLYSLATEIYALAGAFGLKELAEAASSLCDLLSGEVRAAAGKVTHGPKFRESVQVHLDALRTLRRPELSDDAAARAEVVRGLRRVAATSTPGGAA